MSHELETFSDGTASFVSARESAWHELGVVLDHTFTADEALDCARLRGWNVRKIPMQGVETVADGVNLIDADDRYMTVRTHPETARTQYLGVVGNYYTPVQNEEMTEFLNALVDESGAHYETAGSLYDGRRAFVTMKLPQHMLVGGVDPVDIYICASNSHDGSTALLSMVTPVRVVCHNTFTCALSSTSNVWQIRHTESAKSAVSEARAALGLTFRYTEAFEKMAERMIQTSMSPTQFRVAAKKVIRPSEAGLTDRQLRATDRHLERLTELFVDAETQENIRFTRWAGLQAMTEWHEHESVVHLKGRTHAVARAERAISGGLTDFQSNALRAFAVHTVRS
uniref:DUF932 domain-containing protein n=1 Tax=Pseudonocardia sp. CA-138482 TaxID=3240023 RepID=UPI003F493266